jgi:hypothetical protein
MKRVCLTMTWQRGKALLRQMLRSLDKVFFSL